MYCISRRKKKCLVKHERTFQCTVRSLNGLVTRRKYLRHRGIYAKTSVIGAQKPVFERADSFYICQIQLNCHLFCNFSCGKRNRFKLLPSLSDLERALLHYAGFLFNVFKIYEHLLLIIVNINYLFDSRKKVIEKS